MSEFKTSVTHTTELVGPAQAEEYLKKNTDNRPVRSWQVSQLAKMMRDGLWEENGEAGVTFDTNDTVAGGQHTLNAIIASGVTVPLRVTRGVKPKARATMNDSAKQRFSDDLSIVGVRDPRAAEPLLRKIVVWDRAAEVNKGKGGLQFWKNAKFGRAELMAVWPEYAESVETALKESDTWYRDWPAGRGALQFTYWLLRERSGSSPLSISDFFSRVTYGSQDPEDKVLILARQKFEKGQLADIQTWFIIRAWNAWVTGEELSKIQLPSGGIKGITDPYPQPRRAK